MFWVDLFLKKTAEEAMIKYFKLILYQSRNGRTKPIQQRFRISLSVYILAVPDYLHA